MHWRRKWQPTPVFLPGESQGRGSLVGCGLWGRKESDTTEVTWQQQQHLQSWGVGVRGMLPRDRWNEIQRLRSLEVSLLQRSAWQRVALSEVSVLRGECAQRWSSAFSQGPSSSGLAGEPGAQAQAEGCVLLAELQSSRALVLAFRRRRPFP